MAINLHQETLTVSIIMAVFGVIVIVSTRAKEKVRFTPAFDAFRVTVIALVVSIIDLAGVVGIIPRF